MGFPLFLTGFAIFDGCRLRVLGFLAGGLRVLTTSDADHDFGRFPALTRGPQAGHRLAVATPLCPSIRAVHLDMLQRIDTCPTRRSSIDIQRVYRTRAIKTALGHARYRSGAGGGRTML